MNLEAFLNVSISKPFEVVPDVHVQMYHNGVCEHAKMFVHIYA